MPMYVNSYEIYAVYWVQVLKSGASIEVGCKYCSRVQVLLSDESRPREARPEDSSIYIYICIYIYIFIYIYT